nr:MAG TPA: Metal-sensitive transcriptional repressor [Caudoviricetes sp.]
MISQDNDCSDVYQQLHSIQKEKEYYAIQSNDR